MKALTGLGDACSWGGGSLFVYHSVIFLWLCSKYYIELKREKFANENFKDPEKGCYQKIFFVIFVLKCILCVLTGITSLRQF